MSTDKQQGNMMRYAGLATQWMAMMGVGAWAGYKLDKKTGWTVPLFLILFPLLALSISMWQLIKELNKPKQ